MAASVAGNIARWPVVSDKHDRMLMACTVDIGASGAATVVGAGAGITCVKSATGVYDVTFPAVPPNATTVAYLKAGIKMSATPTVSQATVLAFSETAGTAQFKTALNAAATGVEPASGDKLWIEVWAGYTGIA